MATRENSGPRRVFLADGESRTGFDFQLLKASAITGRVRDANWRPVRAMTITVMEEDYRFGRRGLVPLTGAGTRANLDGEGAYRLYGLRPGKYYLRAEPSDGGIGPVYYYPGEMDVSRSLPVTVSPGADAP